VALAFRLFRLLPERFARLGERLVLSFVDGLAVLRDPRSLVTVLGLSLGAWLAEATMYFVIMLGFPFPARPEAALLGAAAANIGTMIPSSPGYVGTFDLPLQLVLTQVFGVSLPEATSYTLVLHAALVLPIVLLGAFFIWRDSRNADDDDDATGGRSLLGGLQAMRSSGGPAARVNGQPVTGEPVGSGQQSAKR
jgi:glycosyltransferase 2 family protein